MNEYMKIKLSAVKEEKQGTCRGCCFLKDGKKLCPDFSTFGEATGMLNCGEESIIYKTKLVKPSD
jgi:hypothetical protein